MQINLIAAGPSYAETNNCGTSLAAGTTCQINITFSPLIGGTVVNAVGIFTGATVNPLFNCAHRKRSSTADSASLLLLFLRTGN